jgi:hypothetical protein
MSNENPFGEFEDDFKNTEKAAQGSAPGRVPPATYKFVLTTNDPKDDGMLIDHEVIVGKNTGTTGFKLFCEILEPESIPNPKTGDPHETKGQVVDLVYWVTQKTLPFIKRDLATILGRDLTSMSEVTKIVWAGRTFEGVVRDEEYLGVVRSRIMFVNPWKPEQVASDKKKSAAKTASTAAKKTTAQSASKTNAAKDEEEVAF